LQFVYPNGTPAWGIVGQEDGSAVPYVKTANETTNDSFRNK